MNFKRIGRILVCLLLICCLTFHAMIPRAEASSIGAAATIVKASTVTCNPYIIAGATLIALGVYAGVETGAFETVANNCVDALEAAGAWIKDGAMELLRTEDADGNASYYVDSGLMEDVRSWVFASDIFINQEDVYPVGSSITSISGDVLELTTPARVINFVYSASISNDNYYTLYQWVVSLPDANLLYYLNGSDSIDQGVSYGWDGVNYRCYTASKLISGSQARVYPNLYDFGSTAAFQVQVVQALNAGFFGIYPLSDLSVGLLPFDTTDLTDGTSARQWSEDYTDRGLKVYGGGSGNNNNDGKWFWPVVLVAGADLLAMSQADQWAGETPKEFDDYTTKEELEIVSRPEVEFAQGVELAPVTSPAPDTGGDTGSDTGTESGNQTDYTSWFERIIKGIEELPSKFESWIIDCKTAIEELPSKFADWFNSIVEKLSSIWETLKTIPQLIIDGFRQLLSDLFVPSPDYIPNKVNALHEKFPYLDTFNELGTSLKDFLIGLGVSPPIIYIDLGAARNSYIWGGRQIFIDLTWYAEYKPTMDFIISAFLWLWFAFRLWQSLPGILQGTSGMWGSPDPYIGFHSWKDPQQKLGSGDGTIYSGPVPVPPERRLGWGRGRGFTERRK